MHLPNVKGHLAFYCSCREPLAQGFTYHQRRSVHPLLSLIIGTDDCTGMMCYFLYWFLQFPLMFVSPQKIRHLFTAKSIIVPFAWLAILIWAMIRAPPRVSLAPKHTSLSGSALSWAWLSALNSSLGFYATVAVNIPDFTVSVCVSGRMEVF